MERNTTWGRFVVWKEILKGCVDLPEIKIPRFFLPSFNVSLSKIRLVWLADSAEFAGGTAVYSGKELSPGNCSYSLLAAKSKMMSDTIPRNECLLYCLIYERWIIRLFIK